MNHNANRFENPERLAELSPAKTLIKIGLEDGMTLCDIGAGSGIFSVAAAKITTAKVFATDINPEMLSVIAEKANAQGLKIFKLRTHQAYHLICLMHAAISH